MLWNQVFVFPSVWVWVCLYAPVIIQLARNIPFATPITQSSVCSQQGKKLIQWMWTPLSQLWKNKYRTFLKAPVFYARWIVDRYFSCCWRLSQIHIYEKKKNSLQLPTRQMHAYVHIVFTVVYLFIYFFRVHRLIERLSVQVSEYVYEAMMEKSIYHSMVVCEVCLAGAREKASKAIMTPIGAR